MTQKLFNENKIDEIYEVLPTLREKFGIFIGVRISHIIDDTMMEPRIKRVIDIYWDYDLSDKLSFNEVEKELEKELDLYIWDNGYTVEYRSIVSHLYYD